MVAIDTEAISHSVSSLQYELHMTLRVHLWLATCWLEKHWRKLYILQYEVPSRKPNGNVQKAPINHNWCENWQFPKYGFITVLTIVTLKENAVKSVFNISKNSTVNQRTESNLWKETIPLRADRNGDLYLLLSENIFVSSVQVSGTTQWQATQLMDIYTPAWVSQMPQGDTHTVTQPGPFQMALQLKYLICSLLVFFWLKSLSFIKPDTSVLSCWKVKNASVLLVQGWWKEKWLCWLRCSCAVSNPPNVPKQQWRTRM